MRRSRPVLPVLLAALVLAGCGFLPTSSLTFEVGMRRGNEVVRVTVVDEAGIVTRVVGGAPDPPPGMVDQPMVYAAGGLDTLAVRWGSSPCSDEPLITVSGNVPSITIDTRDADEPCDASLVMQAVTLELNRVVDASAVEVRPAPD